MLMCATFTEVAMNAPALWRGLKLVVASNMNHLPENRHSSRLKNKAEEYLLREDSEDDDPAPQHERVPAWMWAFGVTLTMFFTCLVLALQYNMVSHPHLQPNRILRPNMTPERRPLDPIHRTRIPLLLHRNPVCSHSRYRAGLLLRQSLPTGVRRRDFKFFILSP